jgi:predicted SAM-dependent methyltransferase
MTKLNVGCGGRRIAGYTGVDVVDRTGAVDIIAPADRIPLPDGSCDEVMAIHVLEHVFAWEAEGLLREWFRLLKPNGVLVLEMPDLVKCCHNIVNNIKGKHPDQLGLWGLFGDDRLKDPLMMHKAGWTFKTLAPLIKKVGFVDVTEHDTKFHAAGYKVRDFRLEARKP